MTIHHATAKKAAKVGIMLTEQDGMIQAMHTATSVVSWCEDATDAIATTTALAGILDGGRFFATQEESEGDFVAYAMPMKKGDEPVARDPDLDDLLTTLDEMAADEPEEEATGSVVPSKYKQMYRERGDETNCGDWLALLLKDRTSIIVEGKTRTDLNAFVAIALLNGIEQTTIDRLSLNQSNGWQGRLRMSVRNAMVRHIAEAGLIVLPKGSKTEKVKAPAEWVEANRKAEKAPKVKAVKAAA